MGYILSKGINVDFRHLDRLGEHEPVDGLGTRRRGERSFIAVVTALGGQERVRIDPAVGLDRGTFEVGHGQHDSIEHLVDLARRHQHTDHGEIARRVGVDEVHFHWETRAIDGVLARVAEVELH